MPNDDIADALRSIGVRVSREALLALLAHATTSRLSPVQSYEHLVALARRERDQRNLAARTKAATLGTFKPLDLFDYNHPRTFPRDTLEQLLALDFIAKGHNVLLRGPSGVGKTMLARTSACWLSNTAIPSASPRCRPRWRICSNRSRCPPSSDACANTPPLRC